MTCDPPDLVQLQSFFSLFDEWQERKEKKPLLELEAFCEAFTSLVSSNTKVEPVTPEKTLLFNDYQNFYENFAPLYLANIKQGAVINVWQQAGLKHDEVRNAAVLAWWLDCNGSHGLGSTLLAQLLRTLNKAKDLPLLNQLDNCQVVVESLPLGDIEDRIDIEIQGDDFLIFIEVKINAREGPEQLKRYSDLLHQKADFYKLKKRALIYLTRFEKSTTDIDCLCISWRQLALVLEKLEIPEDVGHTQKLLWQFCNHIQSF